jgi:hypothetical protein
MTDERGRDDDSVDSSDWLAAQFGSDDDPAHSDDPVSSDQPAVSDQPPVSDQPVTPDEPVAAEKPAVSDQPVVSDEQERPRHEPSRWAPVAHPVAEAIPIIPTVPAFTAPPEATPPVPPLTRPFLPTADAPAVKPDPPVVPAFSSQSSGGVFNWGLRPTGSEGSAADQNAPDTEALSFSEAEAEAEPSAASEAEAEAEGEPSTASEAASEPEAEPEPEAEHEGDASAETTAMGAFTSNILAAPATQILPAVAPSDEVPPDASLAGIPPLDAGVPTVAFAWEGTATELFAPAAPSASVAEPATELFGGFAVRRFVDLPGADLPSDGSGGGPDAVDELFGGMGVPEDTGRVRATAAPARSSSERPSFEKPSREKAPRSQLVLVWVAVALVALLAIAVLFFVGTRASQLAGAAPVVAVTPSVSTTPSQTPSATPTVLPVGPVAVGTYKWDALRGGECLAAYDSAWAEKFTVVDCATPHPAQMIFRGTFPGAEVADAPYPGVDALQAQINLLCTTPSVINLGAAGAYNDIQVAGSFPATAKQWASGSRSYFCFVTRSSGQPLTTSVAQAPAA